MFQHPFPFVSRNILFCSLALGISSCSKPVQQAQIQQESANLLGPLLKTNQFHSLPNAAFRNQTKSPIHWQPWTKETLARAKAAKRLIFGVVVMPQQPEFQTVLATLSNDSQLVSEINRSYVPILIDGDASGESDF